MIIRIQTVYPPKLLHVFAYEEEVDLSYEVNITDLKQLVIDTFNVEAKYGLHSVSIRTVEGYTGQPDFYLELDDMANFKFCPTLCYEMTDEQEAEIIEPEISLMSPDPTAVIDIPEALEDAN